MKNKQNLTFYVIIKVMNYGDYIWDLGGTLLDNYQVSTQAFQATLKQFNRTAEFQTVYDALKVSTSTAIGMFAPDIADFRTLYKQEEAKHLQEPVLFEGSKAILAKIVSEGGRNFLVSHRNHLVLDILDKAEITPYFTEIVTSENGFARKPSPESFLYLIKKYDIKHGLVIGDRQIDIEAGKAAGMNTLLVDGHKSLLEIVT